MESNVSLLIALLVCHYLADFCLTWPDLIEAKAEGRPLRPIQQHAAVHAVLMGCCLLLAGTGWLLLLALMALEWVTHFVIDTAKAHLSVAIPILAAILRKPYWMLYGLDQLLHQIVVVVIWYAAVMPHS